MRECPAPGCHEKLSIDRYACRSHWFSLPLELRKAITRTWGMRSGQPGNEQYVTEHEEAKAAADRWLEARYG